MKMISEIVFQPLQMEDKKVIESFLSRFPHRLSYYTFPSLVIWNQVEHYEWSICSEQTLFIARHARDGKRHIHQPIGIFPDECADELLADIQRLDYPISIFGVNAQFIEEHPSFVSHFDVINERGSANYIYRTEDLAFLKGKAYSPKRNLISQAKRQYEWTVETLDYNKASEYISTMEMFWEESSSKQISTSLKNELIVFKFAMKHFAELELRGIVIKIDGKLRAFSIFDKLNSDTIVIRFEKADRTYQGLYQVVNQEAAKFIYSQGFSLINREEDLNLPGLRQAKLSYHPIEIYPSFTLELKSHSNLHSA